MGVDFSLEEWIQYIFDNPADDHSWQIMLDTVVESPAVELDYLTRLFENPVPPLAPYSDAQVNNGLWYIAGLGPIEVVRDPSLPLERRTQCIWAMVDLYAKLFATRCSPHLGHLDEPGTNPVNLICYMWWDIVPLPLYEPPFDPLGLQVMTRILTIDSIACQEGALHGLGHMAFERKDEAAAVIDQFLEQHPNIRPELRTYALAAKTGCIL